MKKKVLIFITRKIKDKSELLVFDHRDYPEAGTQIPAGTVEQDEAIEAAAMREVWEESGLRLSEPGRFLGKFDYTYDDGQRRELRHVFHVCADMKMLDCWEHIVGGDGIDKGMVFQYYWVPLREAKGKLHKYQNEYLNLIE